MNVEYSAKRKMWINLRSRGLIRYVSLITSFVLNYIQIMMKYAPTMPWIDFLDTYIDGRTNSELKTFYLGTCLYQLPYAAIIWIWNMYADPSISLQSSSNNFMRNFCIYLFDAAHSWITDLEETFNLVMIAKLQMRVIRS